MLTVITKYHTVPKVFFYIVGSWHSWRSHLRCLQRYTVTWQRGVRRNNFIPGVGCVVEARTDRNLKIDEIEEYLTSHYAGWAVEPVGGARGHRNRKLAATRPTGATHTDL